MTKIIIEDFLKPINAISAVGEDARYAFCYEVMESEIKKFGSLLGESVDWEVVQTNTTQVLCLHSKDLKAACYFARAQLDLHGIDGLEQGLLLLLSLISRFGSALYPQRKRARDGGIQWLNEQLEFTLPKMDVTPSFLSGLLRCHDLIELIQGALNDAFEEKETGFTQTRSAICSLLEKTNRKITHDPITALPKKKTKREPSKKGVVEKIKKSPVNKANEIDIQTDFSSPTASIKSLKKVAETLLSSDPSAPISYRLHRYLTWSGIDMLNHQNNITPLYLSVSQDEISDYRKKTTQEVDINLVKGLEKTLTDIPFWLTGHYFSYLFLEILGHYEAADAVMNETRAFIASVPGIEHLLFRDSQPFADEATKKWLTSRPLVRLNSAHQGSSTLNEGEGDTITLENITLENTGEHLLQLDQRLELSLAEREQFLLHLQTVKLFLHLGLRALCLPFLENTWRTSEEMKLERWEPPLFANMKELTKSTLKSLYPNKEQLPIKYQRWQCIYTQSH